MSSFDVRRVRISLCWTLGHTVRSVSIKYTIRSIMCTICTDISHFLPDANIQKLNIFNPITRTCLQHKILIQSPPKTIFPLTSHRNAIKSYKPVQNGCKIIMHFYKNRCFRDKRRRKKTTIRSDKCQAKIVNNVGNFYV